MEELVQIGGMVKKSSPSPSPPDWQGWILDTQNPKGPPLAVHLWESSDQPAAIGEYHGFLQIEGYGEYAEPRPCPGGSPFQATSITWNHLNAALVKLGGFLSSDRELKIGNE